MFFLELSLSNGIDRTTDFRWGKPKGEVLPSRNKKAPHPALPNPYPLAFANNFEYLWIYNLRIYNHNT